MLDGKVASPAVAPRSTMTPAGDVDAAATASPLFAEYGARVDAQSARELLAARMAQPPAAGQPAPVPTELHKKAARAAGDVPARSETFSSRRAAASSSAGSSGASSGSSRSR